MAGFDTSPTETGRFTFESNGFRYEVFRSLLEHEDFDTPWLAWCRPLGVLPWPKASGIR